MGRWKNTELALAEGAASNAARRSHDSLADAINQGILEERSRVAQVLGVDIGTVALLGSEQCGISIQITVTQPEDPKPVIGDEV